MLTHLTWANYLTIVAIITGAWYLFVGLKYYRAELFTFTNNPTVENKNTIGGGIQQEKQFKNEDVQHSVLTETSESEGHYADEDDTEQQLDEFAIKIKEAVEESVQKKYNKEDTSLLIALILKEYTSLKDSLFRPALEELILSEFQKKGSHLFTEDDVPGLWDVPN